MEKYIMKNELYAKGIKQADFSSADYVSEYNGRQIGGFIIDSTDAPATLKITDELGTTAAYVFDAGYHPISVTAIKNDVGNSITTCKVFY